VQERPAPPPPPKRASEREPLAKAPAAAHQAPPAPLAAASKAPLLRELLKNPQSLRAAIMLREVLDAPLSRRRNRRGLP
jgi:hypothetical protein